MSPASSSSPLTVRQQPGPCPAGPALSGGPHAAPGLAAYWSPASCSSRRRPRSSGWRPGRLLSLLDVIDAIGSIALIGGGRLRALSARRPRQAPPALARAAQADPLLHLHRRRAGAADRVVLRRLGPRPVPERRRRTWSRNGVTSVTNEAVYLARMTALEIQRGPGPQAAGAILAQREATLASRYPGASIALVPDRAGAVRRQPRSARGRTGSLPDLAAANAQPAAQRPGAAAPRGVGPVVPLYAGPWEHVAPPGRAARMGQLQRLRRRRRRPRERAASRGSADVRVRAARRRTARHGEAHLRVVVDIPKNDRLVERIREETSVKIRGITASGTSRPATRRHRRGTAGATPLRPRLGAGDDRGAAGAASPTASRRRAPASGKRRISWVAWLEYTDWATGEPQQRGRADRGEHRGHLRPRVGHAGARSARSVSAARCCSCSSCSPCSSC